MSFIQVLNYSRSSLASTSRVKVKKKWKVGKELGWMKQEKYKERRGRPMQNAIFYLLSPGFPSCK